MNPDLILIQSHYIILSGHKVTFVTEDCRMFMCHGLESGWRKVCIVICLFNGQPLNDFLIPGQMTSSPHGTYILVEKKGKKQDK